jgi:hypothetical protein
MLEAALIYLLISSIQFASFKKAPYSRLQNNPRLQYKFGTYYSKRRGKYRAFNEEAYYNALAKQAKSGLIGFFLLLPVYILVVVVYYSQIFA